jgi:hypothetical protein
MADKEKKEQKLSVDDAFLKDFIAKGGKVEDDKGAAVDEGNVDALLEEVANKEGTPKQAALHKKAVSQGTADTTKEDAEKKAKELARNDRLRQQELKKQRNKALNVYSKTSDAVQDNFTDPLISKAGNTVDRISSLKTVGGIGLLLVVLIFLLFVVVQVNSEGDTRIKQLWYMLNGRAKLIGRQLVGTGGNASSSTAPSSLPSGTPGVTLPGGVTVSTGLSTNKPTLDVGPVGIQYTPDIIPTPWGTISIPDISIGGRPITGG